MPASLVAGMPLLDGEGRPVLVIDDDATIVVTHSEKERTAATFKHSYGFHPVLAFCDNSDEALAGIFGGQRRLQHRRRPHRTARCSVAQIPDEYRHGTRSWSAPTPPAHPRRSSPTSNMRDHDVHSEFSIGWAVTDREHTAIAALPPAWTPAVDIDGDPRDSAAVAELTGALPAAIFTDYPAGMRIIVRRERPHPGAQLDLFEHRDGLRHLLRHRHPHRAARLARRPPPRHARVEDRIRCGKDTGFGRFPSRQFAINAAWLDLALTAIDLLAWTQTSCCATTPHWPKPTEDAALPTPARRRPPGPRRTRTSSQDRPHLALGARPRPRLRAASCTTRPRDLTHAIRTDEPNGRPGTPRGRATTHIRTRQHHPEDRHAIAR